MSKLVEKKIQCQNSIWCTLKKATTKNSEWPDKVRMLFFEVFRLKIIIIFFNNII